MTLKEKFQNIIWAYPADESVKIADDYAIEFAEWLRQKTAQVKGNRYKLFSDFEIYTLKELLEIFKKEKHV